MTNDKHVDMKQRSVKTSSSGMIKIIDCTSHSCGGIKGKVNVNIAKSDFIC